MGYTWHPTNQALEGGADGFIEIRDPITGELTNNILQAQIKATTRKWTYETNDKFTYRCEERDIDYWLKGNTPVILIAVRPDGREAYWIDVKDAFSDPDARKDRHLHFDKINNLFTTSAASHLLKLATPRNTGPYLPCSYQTEQLVSNLLPVMAFPKYIYIASSKFQTAQEIFSWEKTSEISLPAGWILTEKTLRSVHNLRDEVFSDVVDAGSVERFDLEEWSQSDNPDTKREFVRLMNRVLQGDMQIHGLWRSGIEKCYFFPANPGFRSKSYRYQSLAKETSRTVASVKHYADTNDVKYIKHSALKHDWIRLAGQWHLVITPHYIYTTNNKTPYIFGENMLAGIKKMEHQGAVLGQVVMWKAKLTEQKSLFQNDDPQITFSDLYTCELDRSIDEATWLNSDGVNADKSDDWGLFN